MNADELFKDFTHEHMAFIGSIQKERSAMLEISCIRHGITDIDAVNIKCSKAREMMKENGLTANFQWDDL